MLQTFLFTKPFLCNYEMRKILVRGKGHRKYYVANVT